MNKGGYVYIMASINRRVLYVGVTSNLAKRIWEHRTKVYPESYTAKYNCIQLVYYNQFNTITDAIAEEKRIKGGSRQAKGTLISDMNYNWDDLYDSIW